MTAEQSPQTSGSPTERAQTGHQRFMVGGVDGGWDGGGAGWDISENERSTFAGNKPRQQTFEGDETPMSGSNVAIDRTDT
jgi:hypothetical protein